MKIEQPKSSDRQTAIDKGLVAWDTINGTPHRLAVTALENAGLVAVLSADETAYLNDFCCE